MLGGIMGLRGGGEGSWEEYSGDGAPSEPHATTTVPLEASGETVETTPTTAGGGY
jgi:hypothetical protein